MSDTTVAAAPAAASTVITDSRGRKLTVTPVDSLRQFDLFDALGASTGNDRLLGLSMLACSVTSIDGTPCPFPRKLRDIRAQVGLVGNEGIEAVASFMKAPEAPDLAEVVDQAKN